MKLSLKKKNDQGVQPSQIVSKDTSKPSAAPQAATATEMKTESTGSNPAPSKDWKVIHLFPPSEELADDLKRMADDAGMTMSDFIIARVQKSFEILDFENAKLDFARNLQAKEDEVRRLNSEIESMKEAKRLEIGRLTSELEQSRERALDLEHEIHLLQSEEL